MTTTRRTLLAGSAAAATGALTGAATGASAAPAHTRPGGKPKPTVVLVHGAFADASGWNDVAARLIRDGYPVIAPANPLRGVAADSAYLASILATLSGPLVLVAHSYGGMVITNAATGNANVTALVYVAAFAPDAGDTLLGLQYRYPGSKLNEEALDFRPHSDGLPTATSRRTLFRDVFAADLPQDDHRPDVGRPAAADVRVFEEPSGAPAWKTVPVLVPRRPQRPGDSCRGAAVHGAAGRRTHCRGRTPRTSR